MTASRAPAAALAAGLAIAAATAPGMANGAGAAAQQAEACRVLEVIDKITDEVIFGIEDIEIDHEARIAILSAHDRWALEDALAAGLETLPQGGLYALPLAATSGTAERVLVENLTARAEAGEDFRPHGLALGSAQEGRRLFVVNQRYRREDGAWRYSPTIEVFQVTADGLEHRRSLTNDLICNPNAVAALGPNRLLVSNDRGACGRAGAWLEDLLPLGRANLVDLSFVDDPAEAATAQVAVSGLRFANGVAVAQTAEAKVYLADTRRDEIVVQRYPESKSDPALPSASASDVLPLTAGPDNLKWSPDGRLLAAVHPGLLRLAFYLKRWFGVDHAPSRILAVDPNEGSTDILFDDPEGELISAASVAVIYDDRLLIGSAFDRGLVVCRLSGFAGPIQSEALP